MAHVSGAAGSDETDRARTEAVTAVPSRTAVLARTGVGDHAYRPTGPKAARTRRKKDVCAPPRLSSTLPTDRELNRRPAVSSPVITTGKRSVWPTRTASYFWDVGGSSTTRNRGDQIQTSESSTKYPTRPSSVLETMLDVRRPELAATRP